MKYNSNYILIIINTKYNYILDLGIAKRWFVNITEKYEWSRLKLILRMNNKNKKNKQIKNKF